MDLTQGTPPSDKREALKWHNRRAIVVAAAQLARERGLQGFTVNDLAQAAGVSRRTVFNHFGGVEEAVQASFLDAIAGLYAQFRTSLGEQRFPDLPTAFRQFAQEASHLDVVGTVCQAIAPFLPEGQGKPRAQSVDYKPANIPGQATTDIELLAVRATDATAREIVSILQDRVDHADPFQAHLLGEYLITTITVCADRWFAATHGELTEETRALWQQLLRQGMDSLGKGIAT
ncbi:TetR/AcrR family transcriptional regulator [Kocuria sp.]|uniref:TetR/AcrR family transcriptional regulator n=1 Tax=Kocuria sp. TaxID=1871328 RepID=UPI0026DF3B1A|nr:TetR/AcrR family transcriptional regulator [Kocuria sp.]MDO5618131.1 TetR/AcrR family transcriptional regulator [Kocuria sp.]